MKRIVILGAGESGAGAAVLAKVKGFETFVSDMSAIKDKYKELLDSHAIAWEEGHHTEELILNADEVVKSPGIPNDAPLILKLKAQGTPVISEIEFAGRYTDAKMICITGSNGKTTTFADFRKYDLLFNAVQFIYTVRSAHPQKEDFIDYYRQIDIPAIARTTSILNYPGGLRLFVNAYMLKAMVSDSSSAGEKRKNPVSAMLKEDVEMISNDTIKGEIALMFSGMSKTQVGLEQYKQEYGSFLVTDSQKKRWQRIEDNFAENMEKKKPINFTFPDAEGNDVSLSDFRGKVVYIDIWATWCGPCKKEMPAMKALEAEYKDNKDIVFMGISVDASKNIQKWKDFVIKEQLPGVQLFGGDMAGPTLSKPYKITGIPRFMLVGKDGSLIYMDAPRPSSSEIRAVLNDALKK